MRTYKARGIVLHTIKYGDSSAIAYLFTDVLGRMSYMVQGIRSKRGRGNKAALLQPMFLVEFEGVEQPHAQMHRVREMRSLRPLMSVPFDVRKSTISMFMAEVLYRLIREVEANKPLFDFLCEAVLKLDEVEILVQVLGKPKARLMMPVDAAQEQAEKIALAAPEVQAALNGKPVKKVIFVPKRLLNIVI